MTWHDRTCPECLDGMVRQSKELKGTLTGRCDECGLVWAVEELDESIEIWERVG